MSGNPSQHASVRLLPARSVPFSPRVVSGLVGLADGLIIFGTKLVIYPVFSLVVKIRRRVT